MKIEKAEWPVDAPSRRGGMACEFIRAVRQLAEGETIRIELNGQKSITITGRLGRERKRGMILRSATIGGYVYIQRLSSSEVEVKSN